jgi:transcriptional regulator with XRE-family HTH domain
MSYKSSHGKPSLGEVIVKLRNERGMTQSALATAIGLGHGSLSRIERGEVASPKPQTIHALIRVLGPLDLGAPRTAAGQRSTAWNRAVSTLSELEELELLEYLAFIRWRGRRRVSKT